MVGVDEDAPGLLLVAIDGQTMDLGAPSERLVLFFCEDVTTGRAVSMAGDFNDQLTEFRQLGVRVIGVAVEPNKIVESFATALRPALPLRVRRGPPRLPVVRPRRHEARPAAGDDGHGRHHRPREARLPRRAAVRARA